MLKTNVGGTDRILRIVVGIALLAWFFLDQGTGFWHYAKLIGIVPLLTGLMSTCPAYSILGLNTCPMKKG
ncbi:YgaP family membrane protein [Pseudotabrizicola sp. L79]|uniref:YgaP family membrane protein n=1 Tax=Pseudotabrizicola sp. L79 TaxID=3118402 RepID=UPI002F94F5CD